MDLKAYTKTIRDILTLNNKYIIPRFQREYSWEKPELDDFLSDTILQIKKTNENQLVVSDYFIGSIVLIGNEKETSFQVVDGQQRLTTITIMFSVLTQIFKELSKPDLVESCHTFIEGKDEDHKPFFKLENDNPKPFLQHRIQSKDIDVNYEPQTDEEKKLIFAYNYFYRLFGAKQIYNLFKVEQVDVSKIEHIEILKAIREQLKRFSVIFITVDSLEDANTIFETLNAKGKDLEAIDLIKNEIFKILNDEHPTDATRTKWKSIKEKLLERENSENITVFLRHFWLSKYKFTQKSQIYESFKEMIPQTKVNYNEFVNDLLKSSNTYIQIISPQPTDWPRNEKKIIFDSILALNIFNVTQTRPLLISLLETNESKPGVLKHRMIINFLKLLENFHFKFTAVTSSRSSGLESIYSRIAIKLRGATNASEVIKIYTELFGSLKPKVPSLEVFLDSFKNIVFTREITKNRTLVKYIIQKIEIGMAATTEYIISDFSIEHISDESLELSNKGLLGNLLPLSQNLNSKINSSDLKIKMITYKKSDYSMVKKFIKDYERSTIFTESDINIRTLELGIKAYNEIWEI